MDFQVYYSRNASRIFIDQGKIPFTASWQVDECCINYCMVVGQ